MRVALLSTLDRDTPPGHPRAPYRRFAGARLIEREIDLALCAGCATIACLVDGIGSEVVEAQRRAEAAGAKFVAMQDPRLLSGLVSAADEVLVLAAGVLPADEVVLRHLAKPAVLVFPAADAVPLGYERIDAEFAWSGAMRVTGSAIERLADLPPDADIIAALLRIALQAGTRIVPLEKRLLDEGRWHLAPTAADLAGRETRWISDHAAPAPFTAPGLAVSERIGARLARDMMGGPGGGRGGRIPAIAAAIAGLVALALAIMDLPVVALGFGALMAVLVAIGETVDRIVGAGRVAQPRPALARMLAGLLDPILVILVALASPEDSEWLRLFVPVMLFGLLRLAQRRIGGRWKATVEDRVTLALALIPAGLFGLVQPLVAALAIAVLLALFRLPEDEA